MEEGSWKNAGPTPSHTTDGNRSCVNEHACSRGSPPSPASSPSPCSLILSYSRPHPPRFKPHSLDASPLKPASRHHEFDPQTLLQNPKHSASLNPLQSGEGCPPQPHDLNPNLSTPNPKPRPASRIRLEPRGCTQQLLRWGRARSFSSPTSTSPPATSPRRSLCLYFRRQ